MPVFIGLLRGVNIGGHHKIKMDVLRAICASLKCEGAQTHLQSGNVVFRTTSRAEAPLAKSLEDAIERQLGFRPSVLLRAIPEFREIIARSPFAKRAGLDPSKLVVSFLAAEPTASQRQALLAMDIAPEELHVLSRELYIYFPNGQARTKISWPQVAKILNGPATARNWNTVTKLLKLAESMHGHCHSE